MAPADYSGDPAHWAADSGFLFRTLLQAHEFCIVSS